jgi:hypothetical protein
MKKILLTILFLCACGFISAQIIQVPDDKPTIQAGINAATDGDTVLVTEGTYLENINFMGKSLIVASHFFMDGDTNHIHNTIIDGSDPDDPDFASVVTFATGEDTTSVLCGFTITGGTGMYLEAQQARLGGGIVCYNATAKIIHNRIIENEVNAAINAWGAGIAVYRETGEYWTVIENNLIEANHSIVNDGMALGGGMFVLGDAIICNNLMRENQCTSESLEGAGGGAYSQSVNELPDTLYFNNNIVQNNAVEALETASGGGMENQYSFSFISGNVVSHNTLIGNITLGGGLYLSQGAISEITGNVITYNTMITNNNEWYGGGIWCDIPTGKTTFRDNEISFNSGPVAPIGAGGGLCVWDANTTSIIVDANWFFNNTAYHGGGFYERSSYRVQLTNNIFSDNTTFRGGAIGIYHPQTSSDAPLFSRIDFQPMIINNTFYSNSASNDAGAMRFQGVMNSPVIFNCIFWENDAIQGKDIYNWSTTADLVVSYSDIDTNYISGSWTGVANINVDPEFIKGDTLCHLSDSSQCQDAGIESLLINDTWYYCPETDYEGDPRPAPYGPPDIGADEYFYIGVKELQVTGYILQVFPNPTDGISDIRYQISDIGYVTVSVFDSHGQKMQALVDKQQDAGSYSVRFDASALPSGIYIIRLDVDDFGVTEKMILVK